MFMKTETFKRQEKYEADIVQGTKKRKEEITFFGGQKKKDPTWKLAAYAQRNRAVENGHQIEDEE